MPKHDDKYIPAMGFFSLAAFYDLSISLFAREREEQLPGLNIPGIDAPTGGRDLGRGVQSHERPLTRRHNFSECHPFHISNAERGMRSAD